MMSRMIKIILLIIIFIGAFILYLWNSYETVYGQQPIRNGITIGDSSNTGLFPSTDSDSLYLVVNGDTTAIYSNGGITKAKDLNYYFPNHSFEKWTGTTPDNWTKAGGGGDISQEQSIVKFGLSAVKWVATSTGEYLTGQILAINDSSNYQFSFYAKGAVGGEDVRVWIRDSDNYYWNGSTWSTVTKDLNFSDVTTSWAKYTEDFTTRSGVTTLQIHRINRVTAGQTFYIDNIDLKPVITALSLTGIDQDSVVVGYWTIKPNEGMKRLEFRYKDVIRCSVDTLGVFHDAFP